MLTGFLLGLLHLLALILLVRLFLPARVIFMNPYAAHAMLLSDRLIAFLRTALPLPSRLLCGLLLLLIFSLRAAVLTRVPEGATFQLGMLSVCRVPAVSYLDWLGVEVLHFAFFWLGIITAYAWLRLVHLLRPFPGYTGDLVRCMGRPLTALPLPALWGAILSGYLVLVTATASLGTLSQPLLQLPEVADTFARLGIVNPLDTTAYSLPLQMILLAAGSVISILLDMQNMLFMLFLLALISALFGSPALRYFLNDAISLLVGPMPPLRLGPLNFAPLLSFFLYGLVASILLTLVVLVVWIVNRLML